jgi:tetratricopeptide (TPR) repeat protein
MIAGSEIQIEVKAGSLRIYRPPNGILIVPASAKVIEVQLLPEGSKLFLEPAAIEALLERASKPAPAKEGRMPGQSAERDAGPAAFLRQYAMDKGLSLEDVEREVKAWGDQVRANRVRASVRQQALAEFQARHFPQAVALFKESAGTEESALDRIELDRQEADREEQATLRRFLDDMIRAAESLSQSDNREEAAQLLQRAAARVHRERYAEWWAEMQHRVGYALHELAYSRIPARKDAIQAMQMAAAAFRNALQVYTEQSFPTKWAWNQNLLGTACVVLGESRDAQGDGNLSNGIAAFNSSLRVFTRESEPAFWSSTQVYLGNAYQIRAFHQRGAEAVESLRTAVTHYQNAVQVRVPERAAAHQFMLGLANWTLSSRLRGSEAIESLRAAVAAYRSALQEQTPESQPSAWASYQEHLGDACERLGVRLSGNEAAEYLRAAAAAFQSALQVYTKEFDRRKWAGIQNKLGRVYTAQEKWDDAAQALENLLALSPDSPRARAAAAAVYQDRLFRFDRAYELNAKWEHTSEGELNFIETNLTTARFKSCAEQAAAPRAEISDKSEHVLLTAYLFACLWADQDAGKAMDAGRRLAGELPGLEKRNWRFRGVRHFVSQHPAFAAKAPEWDRLFEALEKGDQAVARATLAALGVPE